MILLKTELAILRCARRIATNAAHVSKLFGSEKWFLRFSHAGVVLTKTIFTVIMKYDEEENGHV